MPNKKAPSILILGAGGHASTLVDILKEQNKVVHAAIGNTGQTKRTAFLDVDILDMNTDLNSFNPNDILLVNGIGQVPGSLLKKNINEEYKALGYKFLTLISSNAHVARSVSIADGVQVLNRALINSGSIINNDCIINSNAVIEHDCIIGRYSHIGPNATLCGGVSLGDNCFIGAGAVVLPGVVIGDNSIVGAGTIVTRDITSNTIKYSNVSYTEKVIKHD